jgi:proton-translocating NADH-quinone oxidoreductase chain L
MSAWTPLFDAAFLVPLLPVLSFVIVGLFGSRLSKLEWGGWVAVGFAGASMVLGVLIGIGEMLSPGTYTDQQYVWLSLPGNLSGTFPNGFELVVGTLVDPVSALMLIPVTIVGFLVLVYSIGYMHHDRGLPRYYAELSLFLAAMTGLVLSDNLLEFFLFWELVGVCSYFLVGFYYERPSAASAAKEAFLVTRVGDVMFLLGVFIYFYVYATAGPAGSLGWAAHGFVFVQGSTPFLSGAMGGNTTLLTVAGLMILGGAAGKSAQFPLHVWLPDAMEGPTTVSALIHAATMVAAGVYLLVVTSLFLGFTSTDLLAIVAIGGFTSFFAATMAVVQPDIKRVIAYSTISQLGYMVLAVGAGFAMVGMFHLFTHAFFKALLFLSAGAVIHAVGTQDLFKMGGLRRPMQVTSIAFLIGGLSLAGIPPFSGFWSKDDILASLYSELGSHPDYWPFFLFALATVFLTGYYIFRAWLLAFSGDHPRDPAIAHPHEAPWVMLGPLVILSGFAVASGFFPFVPAFAHLLPGTNVPPPFAFSDFLGLTGLSLVLAVSGMLLAYALWGNGRVVELPAGSPLAGVRTVLLNRYYMKWAYDAFGLYVVYTLSRAADFVDRYVIDGTVKGLEHAFGGLSERGRRIQSGIVLDYATFIVAGLVALLLVLLVIAPMIVTAWGG